MTTREICWLAGLLEGEAFFGTATSKSPIIQLQMVDRDVVSRVAKLIGASLRGPFERGNDQAMFRTAVFGNRAAAWMMTLYPLLGERRRARVREALGVWRTYVAHCKDREFCKRGHRLAGANVLAAQWTDSRGVVHRKARRCRECHNAYVREWRRGRSAA